MIKWIVLSSGWNGGVTEVGNFFGSLSNYGTLSERAGVHDFKISTFKLPPLPGSPQQSPVFQRVGSQPAVRKHAAFAKTLICGGAPYCIRACIIDEASAIGSSSSSLEYLSVATATTEPALIAFH